MTQFAPNPSNEAAAKWHMENPESTIAEAVRLHPGASSRGIGRAVKRLGFQSSNPGIYDAAKAAGVDPANLSGVWTKTPTHSFFTRFDKTDIGSMGDELRQMFADASSEIKSRPVPKLAGPVSQERMVSYVFTDMHWGLYSWKPETGQDQDTSLGIQRFITCFHKVVDDAPATVNAVFEILGDAFHVDDLKNMTPQSNNLLDADGRLKVVLAAQVAFVRAIEYALQKHQFVDVRGVKGNHDMNRLPLFLMWLDAYFKDEPRVQVHISMSSTDLYVWGQNLIMLHHGNGVTLEKLAQSLPNRYPMQWAATRCWNVHTGDKHHWKQVDVHKVRVTQHRAPTGPDAYHSDKHYNSIQDIHAHVFSADGKSNWNFSHAIEVEIEFEVGRLLNAA